MSAKSSLHLRLNLEQQLLELRRGDALWCGYRVSTARKGAGERLGSECTPRGRHQVVEKFGAGCAPGTVFVARRASGELYHPALAARYPQRDWILSRILRLAGCEPGRNQGGDVDTYNRFIYIHGAPDGVPMGVPGSHGCIRMTNTEVMELFERVPEGAPLEIE